MTLRTSVPVIFIFGAMVAHDVVDESHNLPEGTNWLVYGVSLFAVGAYWVIIAPLPWVGSFLALAGLWFVFDSVTAIRYGPSQTTHEYISGLEEDQMGETMLRMQTLNVVYQGLRDALSRRQSQSLLLILTSLNHALKVPLDFWKAKAVLSRRGTNTMQSRPDGAD
ncbi:hypothetical protein [Natrinema sp. SYSU A 869]|uniref:hypothetical protein n=1 Tax=Natrinema sp. SYSU A 869 TaxID=2871694 RepID=UPI002103683B|nr:hypothetical protein [Natrinema sp. SYSU A 869]